MSSCSDLSNYLLHVVMRSIIKSDIYFTRLVHSILKRWFESSEFFTTKIQIITIINYDFLVANHLVFQHLIYKSWPFFQGWIIQVKQIYFIFFIQIKLACYWSLLDFGTSLLSNLSIFQVALRPWALILLHTVPTNTAEYIFQSVKPR